MTDQNIYSIEYKNSQPVRENVVPGSYNDKNFKRNSIHESLEDFTNKTSTRWQKPSKESLAKNSSLNNLSNQTNSTFYHKSQSEDNFNDIRREPTVINYQDFSSTLGKSSKRHVKVANEVDLKGDECRKLGREKSAPVIGIKCGKSDHKITKQNSDNFQRRQPEQLILNAPEDVFIYGNVGIPLQFTVEFVLELNNLYNIDLFDKGYYHVRISVIESNDYDSDSPAFSSSESPNDPNFGLKNGKSSSVRSENGNKGSYGFFNKEEQNPQQTNQPQNQEQNIKKDPNKSQTNLHSEILLVKNGSIITPNQDKPQFTQKQTSTTKTQKDSPPKSKTPTYPKVKYPTAATAECSIAYKREQINLNEIYLFRVHKLINCSKLDELEYLKVPFLFELYWDEDADMDDRFYSSKYGTSIKEQAPQRVSQRVVTIEWSRQNGLHAYGVCTFEYGYTAAIDFIVHGSLIAIHQPYKNDLNKLVECDNISPPRLEDILFTGMGGKMGSIENITMMGKPQLISLANTSHVKIINVLNQAYEILANIDSNFISPTTPIIKKSDKIAVNFKEKIDAVSICSTLAEAIDQINLNLASVISLLLERWTKCQERWALNSNMIGRYRKEYFKRKQLRFNRGTIVLKNVISRDNFSSLKVNDREAVFNKMASTLKESLFFNTMYRLPVMCQEIDPSIKNHIILIQDEYKLFNGNEKPLPNQRQLKETNSGSSDSTINSKTQISSEQKLSIKEISTIKDDILEIQDDYNKQQFQTNFNIQEDNITLNNFIIDKKDANFGLDMPISPSSSTASQNYDNNVNVRAPVHLLKVKKISESNDHFQETIQSTLSKSKQENRITNDQKSISVNDIKMSLNADTLEDAIDLQNGSKFSCLTCGIDNKLKCSIDQLTNSFCMPRYFGNSTNPINHQNSTFKNTSNLTSALNTNSSTKLYSRWSLMSELNFNQPLAYFPFRQQQLGDKTHLIVCAHGLEGSSSDLRLFRSWIERVTLNQKFRISWLMSSSNTDQTFDDINVQGERLADEVLECIEQLKGQCRNPNKISFVGHSMGALVAKCAAQSDKLKCLRHKFYTYLSISGPHLGLKYHPSTSHSFGLWLLQKFKKSISLQQLQLKDTDKPIPFLYVLLRRPTFSYFAQVLLISSAGDKYVPFHSSRIELSKEADNDKSDLARVHKDSIKLVQKLILESKRQTKLIRFHIQANYSSTPGTSALENAIIQVSGRQAHIMALENEGYMEKFLLCCGAKYFI